MKLWLLRPIKNLPPEGNPWENPYDKAFGFVIRAETAARAREMAQYAGGGDEIWSWDDSYTKRTSIPAWLTPTLSTCTELIPEGKEDIVMRDFISG